MKITETEIWAEIRDRKNHNELLEKFTLHPEPGDTVEHMYNVAADRVVEALPEAKHSHRYVAYDSDDTKYNTYHVFRIIWGGYDGNTPDLKEDLSIALYASFHGRPVKLYNCAPTDKVDDSINYNHCKTA